MTAVAEDLNLDLSAYAHSPAHLAVARRDHAALHRLVSGLPRLAGAGDVATEEESLAAEIAAEAVSAAIDRRDVPGRETPLHLAVRLRDAAAAEILAVAGADWSLQNERGWSGLQEAVYARADAAAAAIARHHRPFAWARWRRRLPSIVASLARVRDFYMEITFGFESSVVPFLSRFAPSDTYRIWKRGPNLRADTTLAGFDGLMIQRSDQSFLFFGEGSPSSGESGRLLAPGSLIVLSHDEKEITDALAGAGERPTEAEVARELATMRRTTMCQTGIDITQAKLVPHLNWRRQQRTEVVGNWKAKAYDMLHVMVTMKTRRAPLTRVSKSPSAVQDHEATKGEGGGGGGDLDDAPTAEGKMLQDSAVKMGNAVDDSDGVNDGGSVAVSVESSNEVSKENSSWFGRIKKKGLKNYIGGGDHDHEAAQNSKKFSKSARENGNHKIESGKEDAKKGKEKCGKQKKKKKKQKKGESLGESSKHESEYKKGVTPVLWLAQDFPLKMDELLPLLDVLANKVKVLRKLRELLTTKLPQDTFPVKVAIPTIPGVRVLVTFMKFEELLQPSDEFATPPSSPTHFQDCKAKETEGSAGSQGVQQSCESSECRNSRDKAEADPFLIPSNYTWIDEDRRTRRGLKAPEVKKQSSKSPQKVTN